MAFDKLLRNKRREHKLRQEDMAQLLDCTQQSLSRWEKGQAEAPESVKCRFAYYFHLPLEEVFHYEEHVAPLRKLLLQKAFEWKQAQAADKSGQDQSGQDPSGQADGAHSWKESYPKAESASFLDDFSEKYRVFSYIQAGKSSYHDLLQDSSLEHFELKSDLAAQSFLSGDLVFFRKDEANVEGIHVIRLSTGALELRHKKILDKVCLWSDLAYPDDRTSQATLVRSDKNPPFQILGRLAYLVRHFI